MENRYKQIVIDITNNVTSGRPMQLVAEKYGISRERVRQIAVKFGCPTRYYEYKENFRTKQKKESDARHLVKYGMSVEDLKALNNKYGHTISEKYCQQKKNASIRGIEFNLSFIEWWAIWEPFYEMRGRGKGKMVMSRIGDTGSYSFGNVFIQDGEKNSREGRLLVLTSRKKKCSIAET